MAARKAKKGPPKINMQVGRTKSATIETDDYCFDIRYKIPGASSVLSLMLDSNADSDSGKMNIGSGFSDILVDSIIEWSIDAPISKESIDGLPMQALAAIFAKVVEGISQEKN